VKGELLPVERFEVGNINQEILRSNTPCATMDVLVGIAAVSRACLMSLINIVHESVHHIFKQIQITAYEAHHKSKEESN
jgi:N-acyl-L-homoserine lactone synthetase